MSCLTLLWMSTTIKRTLSTLTEGTKLPRLFSPGCSLLSNPTHSSKNVRVEVSQCANMLYVFQCTVCSDPQWATSTNKKTLTELSFSCFSIIAICVCRYSESCCYNVVTVTHCLKSQYIPLALWSPTKINFSFSWTLWIINCIFSHRTAHKIS